MLTLLTLARSGIPIWQKLDGTVSTGYGGDVGLAVVNGWVGIGAGGSLDDVFTFDLEEDVICGKWTHGLFDAAAACCSRRGGGGGGG